MQNIWQSIETELYRRTSGLGGPLRPGASKSVIEQTEKQLGLSLPAEVKACYQIHNGSAGAILGTWKWLPLEELCQEWQSMRARPYPPSVIVEFPFASGEENDYWVLMMRNGSTGQLYLHFDAGDNGRSEYVLFYEEPSAPPPHIVASNLRQLLQIIAKQLVGKITVFEEGTGRIHSQKVLSAQAKAPKQHLPERTTRRVAYPGLSSVSYAKYQASQQLPHLSASIEESWNSIRISLLDLLAVDINRSLRPGATEDELQQAERRMHVHFPQDITHSYACCDGMHACVGGLMDLWLWCSLEDMYQEWKKKQEESTGMLRPIPEHFLAHADRRIESVWWHPKWIPLMVNRDNSLYCLDLAPTRQGQIGQIILLFGYVYDELESERIPPVVFVAPNVRLFLAALAKDLERGKYAFDDKTGVLWSLEGWTFFADYPHEIDAVRALRRQELAGGSDDFSL